MSFDEMLVFQIKKPANTHTFVIFFLYVHYLCTEATKNTPKSSRVVNFLKFSFSLKIFLLRPLWT